MEGVNNYQLPDQVSSKHRGSLKAKAFLYHYYGEKDFFLEQLDIHYFSIYQIYCGCMYMLVIPYTYAAGTKRYSQVHMAEPHKM